MIQSNEKRPDNPRLKTTKLSQSNLLFTEVSHLWHFVMEGNRTLKKRDAEVWIMFKGITQTLTCLKLVPIMVVLG